LATLTYNKIGHLTYAPFLRIPQKMPIFSEITVFGENHAVLELLFLKLGINGKVVHYWSLQDVKYPLSPYH
jgi:hypothetical protein